jgi:type I restriction-modification system DNA methylase subunit
MAKPDALKEMWGALSASNDRLGDAITLVFLRQMFDRGAPLIAGHDPRSLLAFCPPWDIIVNDGNRACWLTELANHLNSMMAKPLLNSGFEDLPGEVTKRALHAVTRWAPRLHLCGGDMLGELLQRTRPQSAATGAFYTPYHVARTLAGAADPQPGEKITDPTCGTGRFLLASLEICRERHDGGEPELSGIDHDADAVRACKLNLLLAGYRRATQPAPTAA